MPMVVLPHQPVTFPSEYNPNSLANTPQAVFFPLARAILRQNPVNLAISLCRLQEAHEGS